MPETIKYGEYTFPLTTANVREQFVYDTDDRTLLGTQYTVTVSGWITASSISEFRTKISELRGATAKHSQRLTISDGSDNVILDLDPNGSNSSEVDDWGPKPMDLSITQISGLLSSRYTFQAQAMRKDCGSSADLPPNPILSITRTYSFSVDVGGYTTRSVSGTLKVRSSSAPVDQFRAMVVPTLPTRFRRIQQQFSQSPDGRSLTFNIVDQEVYRTLPPAVVDGEATWSIRIADLGARVFYALNGRFKGGPTTPKGVLFTYLLNLINSRFPLNDPSLIFEETSIDDSVYDNEIVFSIVASGVAGAGPTGQVSFTNAFQSMIAPPPDSNGLAFLPGPFGASPAAGSVSGGPSQYDSCDFSDEVESIDPDGESSYEGDNNPVTEGGAAGQVDQSGVTLQHILTPFMEYNERLSFDVDYGLKVFDVKGDDLDTEPYAIRVHRPRMFITQVGYMTVASSDPLAVPPIPAPVDPNAHLVHASIQPHAPQPISGGSHSLYTFHWRYVMAVNKYVGNPAVYSVEAQIVIPDDPRLKGNQSAYPFLNKLPWLDISGE